RPHRLDRVEPFLAIGIAVVMLALCNAEHVELVLVPAADDVDAEAAAAHLVDGDELLGREYRMDQRRVNGAKDAERLRMRQESAGPGDGLETQAFEIGGTTIAAPASDRQHEIDAGGIGHLRELEIVFPGAGPALGNLCRGAAGGAIAAKKPELQLMRAE